MHVIDKYQWYKAPLLADDLTAYAKRNADWAAVARPDMLERNATYFKALHSIWNIVRSSMIDAYALRPDRRAMKGLATITLGQTVYHPAVGRIAGNQLDLSFDEGVSVEEQRPVIRQLVSIARKDGAPVFGALTGAEQERAEGLGLILPPVGPMAPLSTPDGDPYGINARGPVQFYFDHRSVA